MCFSRDLVRHYTVEVDHDVDRFAPTMCRKNFPSAMDGGTTVLAYHSKQLAAVAGAEDFASLGKRRHVMLVVKAVHRVGQRRREHSARDQVRQRDAEERTPALAASEQLQRLHWHEDQCKPPVQVEVTGVRENGGDRQGSGPALESRQQRLGNIKRDHFHALSRKFKCDATRTSPDVQHGSFNSGRKRVPYREVLVVPSTLEVMPDRLEVHPSRRPELIAHRR